MNILEATTDQNLFAPWFKVRTHWQAWFAFLAALFGLPMDDKQAAIYRKHTGRQTLPDKAADEAWLIVGRRGGKSFVMALVAVYLACFREYRPYLQPGERATIAVIAADRKQARTILRYVKGLLTLIPMFKRMIEGETVESFDLNNAVTIEVTTASFRSSRGYTFAAVLIDEVAFVRTGDESANPDYEIIAAVRPGLISIPGSMLICASSPHARRGELFEAYRKWWGKDGAPLVWKATTREMNPSIPQRIVDEAVERDPSRASAEYLGEFRNDTEQFVSRDVVEDCVSEGVRERQPASGVKYRAFVDPSGGSADSMTLAIAHAERGRPVLDAIREVKPPFSPEAVVEEFAGLLKTYKILEVTGDRYAGEWPRERFRKCGVAYSLAPLTRSELYKELLPRLNSAAVDLLHSPKCINQLVGLERRVARGGRESIDHAPGGHDDVANAVAGAIHMVSDAMRLPTPVSGTYSMFGPSGMDIHFGASPNSLCGRCV